MQTLKQHFYSPRLGLFLIRLVAGTIFIYHGITKLSDMHGTIGFFTSLGFGAILAWVTALVELLGGISLILGLWSRLFGALLSITMIVAIFKVTYSGGFTMSEAPLLLLATSLSVLFSGCGHYSVCAWGHQKNCGTCANDGKCGCAHDMK